MGSYVALAISNFTTSLSAVQAYNIASSDNGYTSYNTGYGPYRWSVAVTEQAYMFRISASVYEAFFTLPNHFVTAYAIFSNQNMIGCIPLWRNEYTALNAYSENEFLTLNGRDYYGFLTYVQGNNDSSSFIESTGKFAEIDSIVETTSELSTLLNNLGIRPVGTASYPITYSFSNAIVSGPSEAAVGDTVEVSAVSDVGYGITDASTQILVTNNDIAVPYTWDAVNQRITFTMPDPS